VARLLEAKRVATVRQDRQLSGEDLLDDYLEHLVAPLIGVVPFPERKAFRSEVCNHLDGLIQQNVAQGASLRDATEAALLDFGEPWVVGKRFLQEWLLGTPSQPPGPLIRKATVIAFGFFGTASISLLILLESQSVTGPHEYVLPVVGSLAFISPFVAGILTGVTAPGQAERGVTNSMLILSLHSFAAGLLMLPNYQALAFSTWAFAIWQMAFWLPAGRVSAAAAAGCIRHYWRQRYWQITRGPGDEAPFATTKETKA